MNTGRKLASIRVGRVSGPARGRFSRLRTVSRSRDGTWTALVVFCVVFLLSGAHPCWLGMASCQNGPSHPWPFHRLQFGITDPLGDAASLEASVPFPLRYRYLSGGVNTARSWQNWWRQAGSYVTAYVRESERHRIVPIFSFYQLRESRPGASMRDEAAADLTNLRDPLTMRAYYQDLKAFFLRAASARAPVVLHVEPDLWGYIEQHARNNEASSVPAAVASSGMPDLLGIRNTAAGFAEAVVRLRNNYAPKVILGYHLSIWGTGKNIPDGRLTDGAVDRMARKAAAFYRSLHTPFDVLFSELADRDAAYAQFRGGLGVAPWWHPKDFAHHVRFLADVHALVPLPIVLWQIPVGNTLMRAMNNTPYHYQDNKVQFLLGDRSRGHLLSYARAGVVAFLFGTGVAQDTCACDGAKDGVTNPRPVDGNTRFSISSDDDGGYLRAAAAAYYKRGALHLTAT